MDYEKLELTPDQLKATKKVYAAIRAAHKLGVGFWDNYGTLAAYNRKKITLPVPENGWRKSEGISLSDHNVSYDEQLPTGAFSAGNADDTLYYTII